MRLAMVIGTISLWLLLSPAIAMAQAQGCPATTVEISREVISGEYEDQIRLRCKPIKKLTLEEMDSLSSREFRRLPAADRKIMLQRKEKLLDELQGLVELAKSYSRSGQHRKAADAASKAIAIDPGYESRHAYRQLGYSLLQLGEDDEAEAAYRNLLRYDRYDYISHNHLGFALERQGNFEAAIEAYDNALKIFPGDLRSTRNRDRASARLDQEPEELTIYQCQGNCQNESRGCSDICIDGPIEDEACAQRCFNTKILCINAC